MDRLDYIKQLETRIFSLQKYISDKGINFNFEANSSKSSQIDELQNSNISFAETNDFPIEKSDPLVIDFVNDNQQFDDFANNHTSDYAKNSYELEQIITSLPDIVWSVSYPDLKISYLSETASEVYGIPMKDFYFNKYLWIDHIHFEDKKLLSDAIEMVKETGKGEIVYRVVRADGQIRYMLDKSRGVFNSAGNLIRIQGLAVDISRLKQSEFLLEKSSLQYQLIFDYTSDGVIITDKYGNIAGLNKRIFDLLGYNKPDMLGRNLSGFISTANYNVFNDYIGNSSEKQSKPFEIVHKDKNDKLTFIEVRGSHFIYECEKLYIFMLNDITDRKNIEEKLVSSQNELLAIYDSSPVLMCVVDSNYVIRNTNKAFQNHIGQEALSGFSKPIGGIIGCINALDSFQGCGYHTSCEQCLLRAAIISSFSTGNPHNSIEFKTQTLREGFLVSEYFLASTAKIEKPNEHLVLISLQDMTTRKNIEKEMNKLLSDLQVTKELLEVNLYQKNALIEELGSSKDELRVLNAEKDKLT